MSEVRFTGQPGIDGYGAGGFRVGGVMHRGGLLILPERIDSWAPAVPIAESDFAAVLAAAGAIDIFLVGMGAEIAPLPRPVRAALEAAGLAVDAMATPAACRTYNVLLAESRRVGAALIPV